MIVPDNHWEAYQQWCTEMSSLTDHEDCLVALFGRRAIAKGPGDYALRD